MNLRKLKCLPFDWGFWNFFDGDPDIEDMFGDNPERLPAIVGRPGRYFDHESKVCWTELPDGRAYKVDPTMFLYYLAKAPAEERPLTSYERDAIRTLLVYNNGPATQALRQRLWDDDVVRQLRELKRDSRMSRRQMQRTIAEEERLKAELAAMSPEKQRLEYLRGELRKECISYGERAELQDLVEHIEPDDVELLEAAGVPEDVANGG